MKHEYQLSCESTVDLPFSYIDARGISVLFYTYMVDEQEYLDDMGRDKQAREQFYQFIKDGKQPKTSQINMQRYLDYFEPLLQNGDVLHINFGSGMTPSVHNARAAAEILQEKYPERKLVIIDSLCSCLGYGLLVDEVADRWDNGMGLEELASWTQENCLCINHQFFSTDMTCFKRSGRVSGAAATVATILNIFPLMHLDEQGRIQAYAKVRGRKAVIDATVREVEQHIQNGTEYDGKFFLGHSNSPELAAQVVEVLEQKFPALQGKIRIYEIGTIIATHFGPGTVAFFFWGEARKTKK